MNYKNKKESEEGRYDGNRILIELQPILYSNPFNPNGKEGDFETK